MLDDLLALGMQALGEYAEIALAGTPLFSTGDLPDLQRVYESATETLANDPSNVDAYFRRGVVCRTKGWHQQALANFLEVIKRQPQHARAWLLLSEVLGHLGDYDQARTARAHALELDPSLE